MNYKNPGVLKFKSKIYGGNEGNGESAFVYFPLNVEELFGVKGRIPVNATFDEIAYKGSLVKYSDPRHMILILKAIRKQLNKTHGDEVDVTIELDTEERKIMIPNDLQKELNKNREATEYFEKLSYSHQREYILYIDEAKKPETRVRRIEKTVEMLKKNLKLK